LFGFFYTQKKLEKELIFWDSGVLGWEGMESFEIESMMPFIYGRRASKVVVIIA
jgi:hypothetical protein